MQLVGSGKDGKQRIGWRVHSALRAASVVTVARCHYSCEGRQYISGLFSLSDAASCKAPKIGTLSGVIFHTAPIEGIADTVQDSTLSERARG